MPCPSVTIAGTPVLSPPSVYTQRGVVSATAGPRAMTLNYRYAMSQTAFSSALFTCPQLTITHAPS